MELNDRSLQLMSETMGLMGMAKNLRNAPPEVFERLRQFVKESGVSFVTVLESHRIAADEVDALPPASQEHLAAHKALSLKLVLDTIDLMETLAIEARELWQTQQISNAAVCDRFAETGPLQ